MQVEGTSLKTMIDEPMDAQFVKVKILPDREGNQHWQYDIGQAIHNKGEGTTRGSIGFLLVYMVDLQ